MHIHKTPVLFPNSTRCSKLESPEIHNINWYKISINVVSRKESRLFHLDSYDIHVLCRCMWEKAGGQQQEEEQNLAANSITSTKWHHPESVWMLESFKMWRVGALENIVREQRWF